MRQRKLWLDYARVLAIISISCNHAVTRAFYGFGSASEISAAMPFSGSVLRSVIFVFSRIGVPFFLMITGALLLGRPIEGQEDIARFYRHNLGRLLITCEIWIFIAFWYVALFSDPELLSRGVPHAVLRCLGSMLFINQVEVSSMWYIPMILCLYLLIPFVNVLLGRFGSRLMLVPCAVVFVSGMLLPNINSFCSIAKLPLRLEPALSTGNLFSVYMLYVLAGYWVSRDGLRKLPTPALYIVSALCFAFSCAYQAWEYTVPGATKIYYNFVPLAVCALFLFACLHRRADKLRGSGAVTYVSKIAFGIYFVHYYLMSLLVHVLPESGLHPLVRFSVLELVSVGGSVAVIYLLSKISVFKKYLFMIKD